MVFKCFKLVTIATAFTLSTSANAALISDFDLTTFDFDITSIAGTSPYIASGTSNGIGWSISPTGYWLSRTVTNGTFHFSALPVATDNLHASGDYTITFDSKVGSLLVALGNNDFTDSINFGLTASDSTGVTFSGTQVVLNNSSGGLVLFENINSLSIQNFNTNGITDGYDLAFHAVSAVPVPAVPVPAAVWLFGSGLIGLAGAARRKKA
jgi:hypothetical protein